MIEFDKINTKIKRLEISLEHGIISNAVLIKETDYLRKINRELNQAISNTFLVKEVNYLRKINQELNEYIDHLEYKLKKL